MSEIRQEVLLQNQSGEFELGVTEDWNVFLDGSLYQVKPEAGMVLNAFIKHANSVATTDDLWQTIQPEYPNPQTKIENARLLIHRRIRYFEEEAPVPHVWRHINKLGKAGGTVLMFCTDMRSPEPGTEILSNYGDPTTVPFQKRIVEFRKKFDSSAKNFDPSWLDGSSTDQAQEPINPTRVHPKNLDDIQRDIYTGMRRQLSAQEHQVFDEAVRFTEHLDPLANGLEPYDVIVLNVVMRAGRSLHPTEIAQSVHQSLGEATNLQALDKALRRAVFEPYSFKVDQNFTKGLISDRTNGRHMVRWGVT